jgi:general secretion pathway protein D
LTLAWRRALLCAAGLSLLASCSGFDNFDEMQMLRTNEGYDRESVASVIEQPPAPAPGDSASADLKPVGAGAVPASAESAPAAPQNSFPGTGRFLRRLNRPVAQVEVQDRNVLLNFENADLREVVRVILGDTLKVNYVYDPRVTGTVSLQTTEALPTEATLSVLETVLRMNGAAMVVDEELFRIVPADEAVRGKLSPEFGDGGPPLPLGYSVRIVPLRYISAVHAQKLLEPFLPAQAVVRVDIDRNMLLLAGTRHELELLLDTLDLFDVDWLAGMSVGLYPLANVAADVVAEELNTILGDETEGPLAGLIRFIPVKRLNALLVVTPQATYLDKVEAWIGRLDRGSATGQNLYVYHLQNGKAAELAKILTEIFTDKRQGEGEPPGRLAPGAVPQQAEQAALRREIPAERLRQQQQPQAEQPQQGEAGAGPRRPRLAGEAVAITEGADIRIIADEINNALLILASAQDYQMVEAAIRKLDIVPLQVLVEATIAEVRLNNELRYGVQWFFKGQGYDGGAGRITLARNGGAAIADVGAGLSYLVADGAGAVRLALEALESVTKVRVISSPHLMIQDNQSAEIQVGNEVAVATQLQQSTTANSNVVNTVQYRDTGVILRVTPRVSSGGMIAMEVEQEVSGVSEGADALTPTISQRKIKSTVVVQSGETVILGGLIENNDELGSTGVPLLARLPILGALFGSRTATGVRTELVVLISPRIVRNQAEARLVTEEMRRRMRAMKQETILLPGIGLGKAVREKGEGKKGESKKKAE